MTERPAPPEGASMSVRWERGLPIVKRTLCRVGAHVWISNTSGTSTFPRPSDFCNCGLTTWAAAQAPPETKA